MQPRRRERAAGDADGELGRPGFEQSERECRRAGGGERLGVHEFRSAVGLADECRREGLVDGVWGAQLDVEGYLLADRHRRACFEFAVADGRTNQPGDGGFVEEVVGIELVDRRSPGLVVGRGGVRREQSDVLVLDEESVSARTLGVVLRDRSPVVRECVAIEGAHERAEPAAEHHSTVGLRHVLDHGETNRLEAGVRTVGEHDHRAVVRLGPDPGLDPTVAVGHLERCVFGSGQDVDVLPAILAHPASLDQVQHEDIVALIG